MELRKAAPRLAVAGTDFELRSTVAAVGELPARAESKPIPAGELLSTRQVQSDPLGDWYLSLADKIEPKQISSILRAALAGNLWQMVQLTRRMADSWPMFAKCCHELRSAVAMVKFKVIPHVDEEGEEPTASAQDKAHFIKRSLDSFEPNRFADEDGFGGMIYDLTDAILNGLSIIELLWTPPAGAKEEMAMGPDGPERRIRASAWVHPRHYGVNPDGSVGVADDGRYDPLMFWSAVDHKLMDEPDKFLVAKYKGKSGSCLGAGKMRALALYWVNIAYGNDFMRNYAQKYGNPFFDVAYQAGIPQTEVDKFERAARRTASQNWAVHPNTGVVNIIPAQPMGADNPIRQMMQMADEQCQFLLLGQTLTTSTPADGGGTRAQGTVHQGVKQEILETLADWIAEILTDQLVPSLLRQNYAAADERPTIVPDFTHVETPLEAAQRMSMLVGPGKPPMLAEDWFKGTGNRQPQPGDEVIDSSGQIRIQSDPMTEEELFDQQVERQGVMAEMAGDQEPQGQPAAKAVAVNIRKAVVRASDAELEEMEAMVGAVEKSGHVNGEWDALAGKVEKLTRKRITF